MFRLIRSRLTRRSSFDAEWRSLYVAGSRDMSPEIGRRYARDDADFERLGIQSMGHLR